MKIFLGFHFLFLSSDIAMHWHSHIRAGHCRIDIELFAAAAFFLTFSTTISPGSDIYAAPNGLSLADNQRGALRISAPARLLESNFGSEFEYIGDRQLSIRQLTKLSPWGRFNLELSVHYI